jgi:N-acetylglucosamine-6-sulfatase
MRSTVIVLASAALAILFISAITRSTPTAAQTTSIKPNFVFILADDMRQDDLKYMPKTRDLLGDQGMQFTNAFVSNPLCCPSRATIMRGQYAHNTGVWTNTPGPDGAWQGYKNHGNEQDNIATRFHGAGYRTGLFGKYFNDYDGSTVPPGWDDWFGVPSGTGVFNYYVNDNGTQKFFGNSESDYATDVLSRETQSFIDASVVANKPFLAYVAPKPPHEPAVPAPRHVNTFNGEKAPRLPSFNEIDVSDKPPSIQSLSPLTATQIAEIDAHHEKRVESLQSVDDLVAAVVGKLGAQGVLSNTYIVFTSDNGWHHGEHRIKSGKSKPYEESIRMPLLVRGPGVQAGTTTDKLTLNTDFFPTFTDLAGLTTPEYVDGRSLRPVLQGNATSWRTAILLEIRSSILGIRTSDGRKYIEYGDGFKEYYDLKADPNELRNLVYYGEVSPAALASRLQALKGCSGDTCRAAEGATDTTTPPPPPPDTAPSVTSTSPAANATGVAPGANVTATFSEAMMASSINGTTFKLFKKGSTTKIGAAVSYDGATKKATLDPTNNLRLGTTYKAVVSTGAKDLAGLQLDQNSTTTGLQQKTWLFTVRN